MKTKFVYTTVMLLIACIVMKGGAVLAADAGPDKKNPVIGKATAPFLISHTLKGSSDAGGSVEVTVTIRTLSPVEGMMLKLTPGEGLEMQPPEFNKSYGNADKDTALSETVTVVPHGDGILYLNVFASGVFNGKKMVRAGAVPVTVGASDQKALIKPGTIVTEPDGESTTVMPGSLEERK